MASRRGPRVRPSGRASERAEPSATRSPVIDQDLYLPVVTDRRRRLLIAAAGLLYPIIISCSGSSTVPCSSFSLPSPLSDMSKSEANDCAERAAGPDRTAVEIVFFVGGDVSAAIRHGKSNRLGMRNNRGTKQAAETVHSAGDTAESRLNWQAQPRIRRVT